jgi:polyisoprenoid-binding protein YceI
VCMALACASVPPGPTDAEVRAMLDAQLQDMVVAISAGEPSTVTGHFAPDGEMTIRGVLGGEGVVLNVDLSGTQQIQSFLNEAGAPPDFYMDVSAFDRTGTEAEQTGQWSITGEQKGTFTINWRQTSDGIWQVLRWHFAGS